MGGKPTGMVATVGVAGPRARGREYAGRAWESEAGDVQRVDRKTTNV